MKIKFSLLLAALTTLCFSYSADAAFVIKKHNNLTVTSRGTDKAATTGMSAKEGRMLKAQAIISQLEGEDGHPKSCQTKSGWQGITSLCTGVVGILFPPALVLAVIFGALGIEKCRKHRGLAIAGLVIGLVGVFIWGFVIAMTMG